MILLCFEKKDFFELQILIQLSTSLVCFENSSNEAFWLLSSADEFCKQIIEEYDDTDDWKPGTINDYEINEYRKCEVIYLSQDETLQKNLKTRNKIDERLFNIITNNLKKYLEKYNSIGYIQISEDTGYMLLRYKTGDYV